MVTLRIVCQRSRAGLKWMMLFFRKKWVDSTASDTAADRADAYPTPTRPQPDFTATMSKTMFVTPPRIEETITVPLPLSSTTMGVRMDDNTNGAASNVRPCR